MINRSTFYKYYQDKYDLLDNFLKRILDEFRESADTSFILATPSTIDNDRYIRIFNQFIEYIHVKRKVFQILWQADMEQEIFDKMKNIVSEQILHTLNLSETNTANRSYADLYARLFSSNLMTIIEWWFFNFDAITSRDIQEIMQKNMKDGLFKTFKQYIA